MALVIFCKIKEGLIQTTRKQRPNWTYIIAKAEKARELIKMDHERSLRESSFRSCLDTWWDFLFKTNLMLQFRHPRWKYQQGLHVLMEIR